MKISVFGMGYVGVVCSACLAESGHDIVGVDTNKSKLDYIASGKSPIHEPGLNEILNRVIQSGKLSVTTDVVKAVAETDISFICVGTPSLENGSLNINYLKAVSEEIASELAKKDSRHTIVVRSTVLPGVVRKEVLPTIESISGLKAGEDFGLAMNPEFLRESTAIDDFYHPPMTIVGQLDEHSGEELNEIYSAIDAPIFRTDLEVAEMVKYACNSWHAVKVTFANEIGNLAKVVGVDGREVMNLVCQDRKLNISSYYMRPGFAFGGSCLPKDVRAIMSKFNDLSIPSPLLDSVMDSNENQVSRAMGLIKDLPVKNIALLGLSFKPNTDDLRESAPVALSKQLLAEGYGLKIVDKNVMNAVLDSPVSESIKASHPTLVEILTADVDEAISDADMIILAHDIKEFTDVLDGNKADCHSKHLLDLSGFLKNNHNSAWQGICWN